MDPVLGANIGNFSGSSVDLFSIETTLVLTKPVFDKVRGLVQIFTRDSEVGGWKGQNVSGQNWGRPFFGTEGGEHFGISEVLSFDWKTVVVGGGRSQWENRGCQYLRVQWRLVGPTWC